MNQHQRFGLGILIGVLGNGLIACFTIPTIISDAHQGNVTDGDMTVLVWFALMIPCLLLLIRNWLNRTYKTEYGGWWLLVRVCFASARISFRPIAQVFFLLFIAIRDTGSKSFGLNVARQMFGLRCTMRNPIQAWPEQICVLLEMLPTEKGQRHTQG